MNLGERMNRCLVLCVARQNALAVVYLQVYCVTYLLHQTVDELVVVHHAKVQFVARTHYDFEPSLRQRHEAFFHVEIRWLSGERHDWGWETFRHAGTGRSLPLW